MCCLLAASCHRADVLILFLKESKHFAKLLFEFGLVICVVISRSSLQKRSGKPVGFMMSSSIASLSEIGEEGGSLVTRDCAAALAIAIAILRQKKASA